jgi:poly-beta-1,6-N-acetyl-D-glucosamine synthase
MRQLSYAIITPVRDELQNLERLAPCLAAQSVRPAAWLIMDDGSADGTPTFVSELATEQRWVRLASAGGTALERGRPIVRAFHAGLRILEPLPDVIVKLDADISMGPEYFERILSEFGRNPRLGIAGGIGYERQPDGVWRQRHGTGPAVWGANRAYRRECLRDILPLEERMGWDTIDLMKANIRGWRTEVFYDLAFKHHRVEGERDRSRFWTSMVQGEAAHYMGYRPSYLAVRTLYRMLRDPAAVGLLVGYGRARISGMPRCADPGLREYVRRQQRITKLPLRIREALRTRAVLPQSSR